MPAKRLNIPRVWVLFLVTALACTTREPPVEMATTTSVVNSGLLDFVLQEFPGQQPRIHAAGSGRAIAMLADRAVDLAITHSPALEARALSSHPSWVYQKLAYNHFVILGPASDPAGIRGSRTAVEAFRRIADRDAVFVSRGDESGTHERELALWRTAGVDTTTERIAISGGSMAATIRQADAQLAYTLADESTWWQLEGQLKLQVLLANDAELVNTYAVIYLSSSPQALALAHWLTSGDGRGRIASYRIGDRNAFTVWPSQCPGSVPTASPHCDS